MTATPPVSDFKGLGLPDFLLEAITRVGYESPSPIQAQSIPVLLSGRDLLGQAQTGTGKTAAFAMPLLAQLDPTDSHTQALVLAPTRELAIQVAEACQTYASGLPGFRVVPIYGGASYTTQLKQLKHKAQLVVGTPGRVMDHIRRGTLKLDQLKMLVLDEADEMLRMGFIDDVEWILEHTPSNRQTALFSATMPKEIQRVAQSYLRDPATVKIASETSTATAINQRYWPVAGMHKLDALTRILEVEPIEAAIIFARTKISTLELAEKLSARGFAAEALNGDMAQAQREKVLNKMRKGQLDILVATDVAARGIDIQRISHVINYDIPLDTEAYVHRIGRTGRAGRGGEAILFVSKREQRLLKAIERATRQPIALMQLPTEGEINEQRVEKFKQQIDAVLQDADLSFFRQLLTDYQVANDVDPLNLAAALAKLAQGDVPLLLEARKQTSHKSESFDHDSPRKGDKRRDGKAKEGKRKSPQQLSSQALPLKGHPDVAMTRYRLSVGYNDGVAPGHIVGAIANEADIESAYIGHIEIFDDFSVVDLPAGMPEETHRHLQKVWVCQRQLNLRPFADSAAGKSGAAKPRRSSAKQSRPTKASPRDKASGKASGKPSAKKPQRKK